MRKHNRNEIMVSRRGFIGAAVSAIMGANIATSKMQKKQNILILWTDEQRADTMTAYGNQRIHAPNLNRLASECFVFEKAYISQPVCTPSRSTVMTGLWPHTNSCTANNILLPESIPCLPELIGDSDYRTGYFGKWHLGDEIFAQHGFEEWDSIEDGYRPYYREDKDKNRKSGYWHFLNELGYKPDTSSGDYSRGFASRLPIEHCKPKFLEAKTCDFLNRHCNDPFVLSVNFLEPHMPFFGPLDGEHDPADVLLPLNFNDPLEENEPLRYRLLRERYRQQGYDGHDLKTETGWRRLIANYWGLVTQVDRSVGAILETLERLGLADNTIIVYTSDHGDMMGAHNLLAKTVMYEESVRVPWLMRVPQMRLSQKKIRQPLSHIDLVPTLLDLAGKHIPESLPGQSLVPLMKGESIREDHVFIEWNPASKSAPKAIEGVSQEDLERIALDSTRTVVAPGGWKLCLSDKDKSQLFNLRDDPGETVNLFDSGKHRDVIDRLRKKIHGWQERVGDTFEI